MKKILTIMLLIIFSFTMMGCNDKKDETDQIIAIVNNTEITQKQFDQYFTMIEIGYESQAGRPLDEEEDKVLIEQLKDQAFEDLILQNIIKQDALQKNIKIPDEQVEADLQSFKKLYTGDNYSKFLEQMGMSEADLKEQIELEQLFAALKEEVAGDTSVNDEEVEEYYNGNPSLFLEPAGMEISHILVETEKEAENILTKLEQGEDFSALAGLYSTCPSKEQGGNLGMVNEESNFVEDFKVAALKLNPGEMTKSPVKTEFGYHIIKAGNFKEDHTIALEEVKEELAAQLKANKQNEVFYNYLQELRDNATIEDKREK